MTEEEVKKFAGIMLDIMPKGIQGLKGIQDLLERGIRKVNNEMYTTKKAQDDDFLSKYYRDCMKNQTGPAHRAAEAYVEQWNIEFQGTARNAFKAGAAWRAAREIKNE